MRRRGETAARIRGHSHGLSHRGWRSGCVSTRSRRIVRSGSSDTWKAEQLTALSSRIYPPASLFPREGDPMKRTGFVSALVAVMGILGATVLAAQTETIN